MQASTAGSRDFGLGTQWGFGGGSANANAFDNSFGPGFGELGNPGSSPDMTPPYNSYPPSLSPYPSSGSFANGTLPSSSPPPPFSDTRTREESYAALGAARPQASLDELRPEAQPFEPAQLAGIDPALLRQAMKSYAAAHEGTADGPASKNPLLSHIEAIWAAPTPAAPGLAGFGADLGRSGSPPPASLPTFRDPAPGFRFDAPGQQHAFNSGGSLAAAWDRGEMDVWKGAVDSFPGSALGGARHTAAATSAPRRAEDGASPAPQGEVMSADEVAARVLVEAKATIMLRNMPNKTSTEGLMQAIDLLGFGGHYDFCFVPIDTDSNNCKGYGFVNFTSITDASEFCRAADGYRFTRGGSNKRAQVSIAHTQGVVATLERMRPWKKKNRQKFASDSRGRPFVRDSGGRMVAMLAEEALTLFLQREGVRLPYAGANGASGSSQAPLQAKVPTMTAQERMAAVLAEAQFDHGA